MKKLNLKLILPIGLLVIVTISIFYGDFALARYFNQNENTKANEMVDEIQMKLHETELSIQIEEELKVKGYSPTGLIYYQIYSPQEQYMVIYMRNINLKNNDTIKDIEKIVNSVAKANNFNSFIVDIKLRE
ncbi:hypothetical protein UACE39S_00400 [Ureibacillus acetophenoni]|uniref:hypothetical protein n=1 Tax=Ureibacillus sp. MALMAid1270 TaxID=3411629 RepID=UPI003BA705A3